MQVFISRWPDPVSDPDPTMPKSSRADRLRIHKIAVSRAVILIQSLISTDLNPQNYKSDYLMNLQPAPDFRSCSGFRSGRQFGSGSEFLICKIETQCSGSGAGSRSVGSVCVWSSRIRI